MNWFEALVLSIIQGATEFLPVSSKSHLLLTQKLFEGRAFGGADNVAFDVLVHVGTLLSILVVFRERLGRLFRYGVSGVLRSPTQWRETWLVNSSGRMIAAVALATIPTGIIGVVGEKFFKELFAIPVLTGYGLCVTAALLASTLLRRRSSASQLAVAEGEAIFDQPLWMALIVGTAQGLALTPGISRSGSTIAVALLLGFARPLAGEFSFLMAVPAIVGVALVEGRHVFKEGVPFSVGTGLMSLLVSAAVGWVALKLLLKFVRGGQFAWFSIYCLAVGVWAIWRFS